MNVYLMNLHKIFATMLLFAADVMEFRKDGEIYDFLLLMKILMKIVEFYKDYCDERGLLKVEAVFRSHTGL
jgi:hypothetical protein